VHGHGPGGDLGGRRGGPAPGEPRPPPGERTCHLVAGPATLAARGGDGAGRPLLEHNDDPEAALEALDGLRRPLYAEVAHETIDVDGLSPETVGERILALTGSRAPS
jgi:shikimate kinase